MSAPYYRDEAVTLHHGDCRDLLPTLPDASVDSGVTDPPYEIGFMGRGWDASGIAYDVAMWRECLRVLKPGGHLLAFGGTRTWHRMVCAVEDAGFEIRDSIMWIYGSGFPKSRSQLKPAHEPIIVVRRPLAGSIAATVERYGTGGLEIDACRIGPDVDTRRKNGKGASGFTHSDDAWVPHLEVAGSESGGRWPSNTIFAHAPDCGPDASTSCVEGCPVAELDAQSGILTSGANPTRRGSDKFRDAYGDFAGQDECIPARGADSGGASRFFPTFRYEAKAPTVERPRADGVAHPTVKPLDLMRWLVRLVTPPGGTVLDHFAGSGTTGEACQAEGFRAVLFEKEEAHLPLIVQRLTKRSDPVAHLESKGADLGLFELLGDPA